MTIDQRSTVLVAFLGEFRRSVRTFPVEISLGAPCAWPAFLTELTALLGPGFTAMVARPETTVIRNNRPVPQSQLATVLIEPGDELVFALGLRDMSPAACTS